MAFKLRWLGVACFEMVLSTGETLVIDPYLDDSFTAPVCSEAIERADWILLTHGHYDHILDIGKIANRCGSTIVCSAQAAEAMVEHLGVAWKQIRLATWGDRLDLGSVQVEVFPGIHVDLSRVNPAPSGASNPYAEALDDPDENVRRKARNVLAARGKFPQGQQLNFSIQVPGNLRVYMFGSIPDPSLFSVVKNARPNVLLLQLLAGRESEAAELAAFAGCEIVIPHHFDSLLPNRPARDASKLKTSIDQHPNLRLVVAEPGRWYEIQTAIT